jgi:pyruvate dehydrogenase E2 component (dihydrolipoamide acetyltransferase)
VAKKPLPLSHKLFSKFYHPAPLFFNSLLERNPAMPEEIIMPKLSDTMVEGTLLKWFKQEGDYVQQGETLFEVETDKAVLEVESSVSGVLTQILVQAGQRAPVGTPIAVIGGELQKVVPQKEPLPEESQKSAQAKKQQPHVKEPPQLKVVPHTRGPGDLSSSKGINASPAAKSYALARGIDLSRISGTGSGGMITLKDVRDFREQPPAGEAPFPSVQTAAVPIEGTTSLSTMRKAIAATVSHSKRTIPHFYLSYDIEMSAALDRLGLLNQNKSDAEKITINDVLIKAAATTLKNYPYLNALYPEQGLLLKQEVNMGIVIGQPDGLIIPVLKRADALTLEDISRGVKKLREKAEAGKFSSDDLTDGTFTISNLGMLGVSDFAAIIYPPQTAILAVSAIKDMPVVKNGSLAAAKIMRVTLSMDHRVVDGIAAARFLRDLAHYLEKGDFETADKPCCTVEDD